MLAGMHNTTLVYLAKSLQLARDVDARRGIHSAVSMTLVVPAMRRSTLSDSYTDMECAVIWH